VKGDRSISKQAVEGSRKFLNFKFLKISLYSSLQGKFLEGEKENIISILSL